MAIQAPSLLFLGAATGPLAAKTAQGIVVWRLGDAGGVLPALKPLPVAD